MPIGMLVYQDSAVMQGQDGTLVIQEQTNRAVHVGIGLESLGSHNGVDQHVEMEATVQFGADIPDSFHIGEDIQMLSQGPVLTAEPFIIDQLEPHNTVARPVDNTEEAAQNEINADLELSMTLQNSLNQDLKGWEYDDVSCQGSSQQDLPPPGQVELSAPGLSNMRLVSPAEAFMDVDNSQSESDLRELAPPTREFMEVSRPCVIKTKSRQVKNPQSTFSRNTGKVREVSSDKGENEVVIQHRASFKKKAPVPLPKTKSLGSRPRDEIVDPNDINDDVFVDDVKSTITQSRLLRRPGGSTAAFVFPPLVACEQNNRSSLDESVLQMASSRHDDFVSEDSDSGKKEDIRFTRAHRSAKLQSLKELFEKSCNEQSSREKRKSGSQERVFSFTSVSETRTDGIYDDLTWLNNSRESFGNYRSYSQTEGSRHRDSPITELTISTQEGLNSPRSRRSISTDVGYEFRSSRPEMARDVSMTTAKPPKHRSSSKNRTPSESSTGDLDPKLTNIRGSPKSAREGSTSSKSSPKSHRDASPQGYISGDDSPRSVRGKTEGSPRGVRHVSFQRTESIERTSPNSPRSWRNTRSITIDTVDHPGSERLTQSYYSGMSAAHSLRSRRAISMETSDKRAEDFMTQSLNLSGARSTSDSIDKSPLERKGSIRELMHFFESKTEGQGHEDEALTSQRHRQRVHSVSPTVGLSHVMSRSAESLGVLNIRHSLELPTDLDVGDSVVQPQPVRIGPKPFYGTNV